MRVRWDFLALNVSGDLSSESIWMSTKLRVLNMESTQSCLFKLHLQAAGRPYCYMYVICVPVCVCVSVCLCLRGWCPLSTRDLS